MEAIERVAGREVFRAVSLPPVRVETDFPPSKCLSEKDMDFLNAILHSLVEDKSMLRLDCVDAFLKARYAGYQSF